MNFVLKQFDDVLLNFSAKRTMDGMDISITAINKDQTERLPLGTYQRIAHTLVTTSDDSSKSCVCTKFLIKERFE